MLGEPCYSCLPVAAGKVPVPLTSRCPAQSRVSPAWETIGGAWHIFLMLANPLHTVTVYEVRRGKADASLVSIA
jgi:hypothetical protein